MINEKEEVGSTDKQHALLSASASARWLTCTPSAVLERDEGVEECTIYAEEGTAAHALAEIKLSRIFNQIDKDTYEQKLEEFKKDESTGKYYSQELEEYVDIYINFVLEKSEAIKADLISFETKVDFSNIVPNGFGTADTILINLETGEADVIDLKFGKGVPVSAQSNSQLMLYAVGVVNMFDKVKTFNLSICQPRLESFDTYTISTRDLMIWAYEYVKPKAEDAIKGIGKLTPSEKACKFCKLAGKCKARADLHLQLAQKEFDIVEAQPSTALTDMSKEQLSKILTIAPLFIDWFKDVSDFALGQLMQGEKIPGFKLVEGRSNRVIVDPEKVEETLLKAGFAANYIKKPAELLGISGLEKAVGKKIFNDLCGQYVIKPAGKLTCAPVEDRRPGVEPIAIAQSDFAKSIE